MTALGLRRQVGLRKLARLIVPRPLQDGIHVQTDARQNLVDLVDRVRLIPAAVVRQHLRVFGLAFRKVVLKDLREIVREAFAVVIVIEVFTQKVFQSLRSTRLDQGRYKATPAQCFQLQLTPRRL